MKKTIILGFLIIILFLLFLFIYLKPRDYSLIYNINNYKITEKYIKKYKIYYFRIEDDLYSFDFVKDYKYSPKRKLIYNIINDDNCIKPYIKKDNIKDICYFEDKDYPYQEFNTKVKDIKIDEKNNINIYNYLNNYYVIWNYKGLDILNSKELKTIKVFNNDIYNNEIIVKINDLIVFPNYENGYEYNELIIINVKNGKKSIIKLDKEISNDSYILGIYKKSIFLVDRKNKIEYEINPYLKKIRVVGNEFKDGKIFLENSFEKISINKLINNDKKFKYLTAYNYKIIDNNLYLSYLDSSLLTKVNNFEDGHIISINNDKIYYLIKDILYFYTPSTGNIKLLQKFEWNFNYENKIFIYEK